MSSNGNNPPPVSPRGPYLAWATQHALTFSTNAVAVGLTVARAGLYDALVKQAKEDVEAMDDMKAKYRASVVTAAQSMRNLASGANGTGDICRTIRAFADTTANPTAVLTLADLDPIAPPTPAPAPTAPTDITVSINPVTGALTLRWKAQQPAAGTAYVVKRRINSAGAWNYVGVSGSDKTFVDSTFTAGPDSVQYSIQGVRASLAGPEAMVTINFGAVGAGGQATVASVKMAA